MELFFSKPTILILLLLLTTAATTTVTSVSLTSKELDAALLALQSRGYTLFPNAITTSDLQVRLLSSINSSIFTLFAPPDSFLFSLDLLSSARIYTFSLFIHVSPNRHTSSDLRAIPRPAFVDTLLPSRRLFVERTVSRRNGTALLTVAVDGVVVSVPDLFIGSNIAVHGLDGILVARYGSLVTDQGSDSTTTIADPPELSYPPESLPPTGNEEETVTVSSPTKKAKRASSHGNDNRGATMRSKHGTFFRFKQVY